MSTQEIATMLARSNEFMTDNPEWTAWENWQNRNTLKRTWDALLRRQAPPKPDPMQLKIRLPPFSYGVLPPMTNETNETNDGLSGHERELKALREANATLEKQLFEGKTTLQQQFEAAVQIQNQYNCVDELCKTIHEANVAAGWWNMWDAHMFHLFIATKFALLHSELSEALEVYRTGAQDNHLTWRSGVAVELADVAIRLFDLAGALAVPLGTVMLEKSKYNASRADHKPEARSAPGGKKY